jgi:hypothetical protein
MKMRQTVKKVKRKDMLRWTKKNKTNSVVNKTMVLRELF